MKTHRLANALALVLGTLALGAVQANEQGLRPLPEDVATQADEMTEDTMPFPEGALQEAEPLPAVVQDAEAMSDDVAREDGDLSPEDDMAADTSDPVNATAPETATAMEPAPAAQGMTLTGSMSATPALEQALATRFASGDRNGNGVLTQAELDALDDDDLDFATIDSDADGSVTSEEWSAQLSAQVASADNDE